LPKISNPSSVTADEGGPVCYQQQVLATRAARGHRHRLLTECGYLVSGRAVPGTAMRKILPVLYRSVEHFALGEQDDERFEQRDAVVAIDLVTAPQMQYVIGDGDSLRPGVGEQGEPVGVEDLDEFGR